MIFESSNDRNSDQYNQGGIMKTISKKSIKGSCKQQIIGLVTLLACCMAAKAESTGQPKNQQPGESVVSTNQHIKLIPSLGYTYFNIQGADVDFKAKSGNSAAVLVLYPLAQYGIELESGIEYLETNSKITQEVFFLSMDVASLNMSQIAVPLRARYTFNPNSESTHYFIKGGLTPTLLVKAQMEEHITGSSQDVKSEMNSLGLYSQIAFGADWGHEILGGRVHFDISYNYGLTKLYKSENGKSAGFQLQAGYAINL